MKIGVIVESFRRPFREGVEVAASIGAAGIQAYATFGSYLDVEKSSDEHLKEALDIVKSNGLVFSAICGDFGTGFADAENNHIYVERSKSTSFTPTQRTVSSLTEASTRTSRSPSETLQRVTTSCSQWVRRSSSCPSDRAA